MLHPSCLNCQIECQVNKNGVHVVEMSARRPLAIYMADEFICSGCSHIQLKINNEPYLRTTESELEKYIDNLKSEQATIHYVWLNIKEKNEYNTVKVSYMCCDYTVDPFNHYGKLPFGIIINHNDKLSVIGINLNLKDTLLEPIEMVQNRILNSPDKSIDEIMSSMTNDMTNITFRPIVHEETNKSMMDFSLDILSKTVGFSRGQLLSAYKNYNFPNKA